MSEGLGLFVRVLVLTADRVSPICCEVHTSDLASYWLVFLIYFETVDEAVNYVGRHNYEG